MSGRQVVLDTETTGLEVRDGHRIIEIGCVELIARKRTGNDLQHYVNPEREIDEGAQAIHGITRETLAERPRFAEIAADLLEYLKGAELIIHNAEFDLGFLNNELARAGPHFGRIQDYCAVVDTLALARAMHPGQRHSLDALCRRYQIDNTQRVLHGARLDAEILADVYLAMTAGQATLFADAAHPETERPQPRRQVRREAGVPYRVIAPTEAELAEHERWLELLDKESGGRCLYRHAPVAGSE
jgi:DNA polymerase-3 subunit epsilon